MFLPCIVSFLVFIILSECSFPERRSKKLYEKHCMNCHGKNGEGLRNLYPPLAGSDFLKENKSKLACIIRYGLDTAIVVNGKGFNHPMPGNRKLSEIEIHNIVNYINQSWGNEGEYTPLHVIDQQLEQCDNSR